MTTSSSPSRLERVLEAFRQHPDIGFYRNRVNVIDAAGRPIPPDRWRVHEHDVGLDASGPVHVPPDGKADLLTLGTRTTTSTFNSGTMAIRRELLDGDVGDAFDEARISADTFLFLAAALSPHGLFLDDRRLTRFRFYGGNTTRETFWLGLTADSLASMSGLAARHGRPGFRLLVPRREPALPVGCSWAPPSSTGSRRAPRGPRSPA